MILENHTNIWVPQLSKGLRGPTLQLPLVLVHGAAMLTQERTLGLSPQALRRVGRGGDRTSQRKWN